MTLPDHAPPPNPWRMFDPSANYQRPINSDQSDSFVWPDPCDDPGLWRMSDEVQRRRVKVGDAGSVKFERSR